MVKAGENMGRKYALVKLTLINDQTEWQFVTPKNDQTLFDDMESAKAAADECGELIEKDVWYGIMPLYVIVLGEHIPSLQECIEMDSQLKEAAREHLAQHPEAEEEKKTESARIVCVEDVYKENGTKFPPQETEEGDDNNGGPDARA